MNDLRLPHPSVFPLLLAAFLLLAACEADPEALDPSGEAYQTTSSALSYASYAGAPTHPATAGGEAPASELDRNPYDPAFAGGVFEEDDPCYVWLNGSDAERASLSESETVECERAYLVRLEVRDDTRGSAHGASLPGKVSHGEPTPFSGGGGNVDHGEPTPFDGPGAQPAP